MGNNDILRYYEYFCYTSFNRSWLNNSELFAGIAEVNEHNVSDGGRYTGGSISERIQRRLRKIYTEDLHQDFNFESLYYSK